MRGIQRVLFEGAYLDLYLRSLRGEKPLLPFRKALERRVKGVIENYIPLKKYLSSFLKKPLNRYPRKVQSALLYFSYLLLYEKRPFRATGNDLKSEKNLSDFYPLLYGVLKEIERKGENGFSSFLETLPPPEQEGFPSFLHNHFSRIPVDPPLTYKDLRTSLPLYIHRTKEEIPIESVLEELTKVGVKTEPTWHKEVFKVTEGMEKLFTSTPYEKGLVGIHDLSIVATLWAVRPYLNPPLWDPFCAPGGKLLYIAGMFSPQGLLIGSDRSLKRTHLAKKELLRIKPKLPVFLFVSLAEVPPFPKEPLFSTILVDPPCSDTGTIPRHPEIPLRIQPEDLNRWKNEQVQYLSHLSSYLKKGGYLLYTTCSLLKEENEEVGDEFLSSSPFSRIPLEHPYTGRKEEVLRFFPHRDKTIGFTAQVFRKEG